jgi:transcriptional regulator with XRE-family HTH domain
VFTPEYGVLTQVLVRARKAAAISGRELARRIGRSYSHVHRIEEGQRRVDALEFHRIAVALGRDPAELYGEFCAGLAVLEREP